MAAAKARLTTDPSADAIIIDAGHLLAPDGSADDRRKNERRKAERRKARCRSAAHPTAGAATADGRTPPHAKTE